MINANGGFAVKKGLSILFGLFVVVGLALNVYGAYKWHQPKENSVVQAEEKVDKKKDTIKITLLGDSNTAISYLQPDKRWDSIITKELSANVVNLGKDGVTTSYFLSEVMRDKIISSNADYYIICLGINDKAQGTNEAFEANQRNLLKFIQENTKGKPILMTNVNVDYPKHYSYDRNQSAIKPLDETKRKIAAELKLPLIDVYKRFEEENKKGNWDTRIRSVTVLDNSQDAGKTLDTMNPDTKEKWFDNIHYNAEGNRIVAEEIVKYFNSNNLTSK